MIRLDRIVATYTTQRGQVNAIDNITLLIPDSVVVGIAGESGCGKSTLMKVLYGDVGFPLGLSSGRVDYGFVNGRGEPVTTENIRQEWFRRISYIPQSSMNSLNPVVRVRDQFVDFPTTAKRPQEVLAQVREFFPKLGLPAAALDAYPHQLSGGMRQRIMVAMATFFQPEIILADEPTTALDVVVQKNILLLLLDLQKEMGNTILLVSHDMGVHYQITQKMLIMYAAKGVEYADTDAIFHNPLHPYTLMLTHSLPTIGDDRARYGLPGTPPSLWEPQNGCRFAARCPLATPRCRQEDPPLREYTPGHFSACHYTDQVAGLKTTLQSAPRLNELAHKPASQVASTLENAP